MKSLFVTVFLVVAGVFTVAALTGCGANDNPPVENHDNHEGHDHAAQNQMQEMDSHADHMDMQADSTAQTTCPVMGGEINKDLFVEYQGKKVYFCCPGCSDTFEENPENYISKLPQFN